MDEDWRRSAACRNLPTSWWFPGDKTDLNREKALEVCATCPVKADCYDYGLNNEEHGIWGGVTHAELNRRRKGRGIQVILATSHLPEHNCGTDAGYKKLSRLNQNREGPRLTCEPCLVAHNEYTVNWQRKNPERYNEMKRARYERVKNIRMGRRGQERVVGSYDPKRLYA